MSHRPATRVLNAISRTAWLITEDALRTILEVAARENPSVEAVAAQLGRPLDNTRTVTVRDGVAVIPVTGPIFHYADFFTEVSGATSIETLARDFTTALHDPAVHSMLLEIDSPGGEAGGVSEFANMVYAARGQKPIMAYVSDVGASAAYWIASATDAIVIDDTAVIGSIGAVAVVPDPSKSAGRTIQIVSSQSPRKRADPTTEGGRSQIQGMIDALADVFVAAVARNRGVTEETVLADYGQGGVFVGQAAVAAGLADRLGSFEGVIADLATRQRQQRPGAQGVRAGAKGFDMASWKDKLKAAFAAMDEYETESEPSQVAHQGTLVPADGQPRTFELEGGAPDLTRGTRIDESAQAEIERLRGELLQRDAAAFAEEHIQAGRAFPAERAALVAAYTQAATDDRERGGQARVDALRGLLGARPAHELTRERVPAQQAAGEGGTTVLGNPAETTAAGGKPMSPERRKQLLAATPLGQQALAERN